MGSGTPVGLGKPTPAFGHPSQEGMGRTPVLASVKLSCTQLLLGEGRGEGSLHKPDTTAPWGGHTLFCITGFKQAGYLLFGNNER